MSYIIEDIPFGKLNTRQTYEFIALGLKNITSADNLEGPNHELILTSLELITYTAERWETKEAFTQLMEMSLTIMNHSPSEEITTAVFQLIVEISLRNVTEMDAYLDKLVNLVPFCKQQEDENITRQYLEIWIAIFLGIQEGKPSQAKEGVKSLLTLILDLVAVDIDIETKNEIYRALGVLIDLMTHANESQAL